MVLEYQATMVKLGVHRGLGHQVLALILVAAGTLFLLLTIVQLSRTNFFTEYLQFMRVEGSSESTVMGPNFHQK
jgi:hypothetical protein